MTFRRLLVLAAYILAPVGVATAGYAFLGIIAGAHLDGAVSRWYSLSAACATVFVICLFVIVRQTARMRLLPTILSVFSFAALLLFAAYAFLFFTSWSVWIAVGSLFVAYVSWAFVVLVRSLRKTPTERMLRLSIFGAIGYTVLATVTCLDSGGLQGFEMLVPFIAFHLAACHPLTLLVLRLEARAANYPLAADATRRQLLRGRYTLRVQVAPLKRRSVRRAAKQSLQQTNHQH